MIYFIFPTIIFQPEKQRKCTVNAIKSVIAE